MFQHFRSDFLVCVGYLNGIMADEKKSQEFLGGGPKFNTVGRDNRSAAGMEEPLVPVNQAGYWLRVGGMVAVLFLLGGVLFYLSYNDFGKDKAPVTHGAITSDTHEAVPITPDAK